MIVMPLLGIGSQPAEVVTISPRAVSRTVIDPADASAGYRLKSDGILAVTVNGTYTDQAGEWLVPPTSSAAATYEVRATLTAGTAPTSGTLGAWEALSTNRTWQNDQTTTGTKTSTLTIEIRPTGGDVVDSASITITATVDI